MAVAKNAVHVGEYADADGVALDLGARGGACERQRNEQSGGGCRAKGDHGVS
ncbi:hypothetical protein ABIF64_007006 [Bradyrhizobium japonicum]